MRWPKILAFHVRRTLSPEEHRCKDTQRHRRRRQQLRERRELELSQTAAAQLARQVAYAYDEQHERGEFLRFSIGALVEVLDRFEQLAARSGWSGPLAELFPIEWTPLT